MDLNEIKQEFKKKESFFNCLKEEAEHILKIELDKADIKLHSISSRVKDINSFIDKSQRKDYSDPLKEIRDIVGLRIVCLFRADIERICKIIKKSFNVLSEDNKIDGQDPSVFGYLSYHFIAAIPDECKGPRYDDIINMPFEIQVRTITMDAWANISHYLDYKSEIDVPTELQRDFKALSGLFYIADTQFERFYIEREKSKKKSVKTFGKAKSEFDQEINLDNFSAYLHRKFPDRTHASLSDVSVLIYELSEAGYKSIIEIENAINKNWEVFLKEEQSRQTEKKPYFIDIGVVRRIFCKIDNKYKMILHNKQK